MIKFKKISLSFLAIFYFSSLVGPGPKKALATIVFDPYYPVYVNQEKAVILYDKSSGKETLIISPTFQGSAKEFGLLIPTPTKPTVDTVRSDVFTTLEQITSPKYYPYATRGLESFSGLSLSQAPSKESADYVTVVETNGVDVYETSILEATNEEALAKWLKENGYTVPNSADFVIKDYIKKGYFFVAAKIDTSALGPFVEGQLKNGHINPLRIVFESKNLFYPVKITGALLAESINPKPRLPSNPVVQEENTKVTVILPEPQPSPDRPVEIPTPYPYPYPTPFKPSYVTYTFYIIGDHKKELPGFSTMYAGALKKESLEKLITDENSNLLLSTSDKKFITKLTKSMNFSEMNNDLLIRDAKDNEPVGTGEIYVENPTRLVLIVATPIILEALVILVILLRKRKKL
ncbi:MAG: DUF2330 domain-containing protein [Patescibacteria group bacterium]